MNAVQSSSVQFAQAESIMLIFFIVLICVESKDKTIYNDESNISLDVPVVQQVCVHVQPTCLISAVAELEHSFHSLAQML